MMVIGVICCVRIICDCNIKLKELNITESIEKEKYYDAKHSR